MTTLDFFVTLRSPYSYLAADRVAELAARPGVTLAFKPVYPIALREPDFFHTANPALLSYLRRDAERVAKMQGIPFAWPQPDPVVQNLETSEVADKQPHIRTLTRLAVAACQEEQGFVAYRALSQALFSGAVSWSEEDVLCNALEAATGQAARIFRRAQSKADACDAEAARNAEDLKRAGHWGTPTLVFEGETFFGQDRIAMCAWHMDRLGYPAG